MTSEPSPMPASASHDERREHPRHPVRAFAQLSHSRKGWNVHLLDMSASGARLAILEEHLLRPGDDILLTVELEDVRRPDISTNLDSAPRKTLRLRGTLVHNREHMLGVEYRPASEVDQVLLALLLSQPE